MSQTYFFTGFPGFTAGRLIKRLLQRNEHARYILLIHPSQEEQRLIPMNQVKERFLLNEKKW
ncbi:hypothetical protein [Brevibacillus sp. H7]|uniref:hypothetical protein n=1 Tax=Brevibacillus sp. H7 TaxID=3349138 RepID=UPI003812EC53